MKLPDFSVSEGKLLDSFALVMPELDSLKPELLFKNRLGLDRSSALFLLEDMLIGKELLSNVAPRLLLPEALKPSCPAGIFILL
jgi:hypothetical protein